jgi:hypothetical protein
MWCYVDRFSESEIHYKIVKAKSGILKNDTKRLKVEQKAEKTFLRLYKPKSF